MDVIESLVPSHAPNTETFPRSLAAPRVPAAFREPGDRGHLLILTETKDSIRKVPVVPAKAGIQRLSANDAGSPLSRGRRSICQGFPQCSTSRAATVSAHTGRPSRPSHGSPRANRPVPPRPRRAAPSAPCGRSVRESPTGRRAPAPPSPRVVTAAPSRPRARTGTAPGTRPRAPTGAKRSRRARRARWRGAGARRPSARRRVRVARTLPALPPRGSRSRARGGIRAGCSGLC